MSFLNDLKKENNYTVGHNGETALKSSLSNVLDLYNSFGDARWKPEAIEQKLNDALKEDFYLTCRVVMYGRDVRGGAGDRDLLQIFLNHLEDIGYFSDDDLTNHEKIKGLVDCIIEFGSFKDIVKFLGRDFNFTFLEASIVKYFKDILHEDLKAVKENRPYDVSLLAKYMPTESSKNKVNKIAYKKLLVLFNSGKEYRVTVSYLRRQLDLVESKLTEKRYEDIDYSKVPSLANLKYYNSFMRNDRERYLEYIDNVSKGKEKINTGTLEPYQIVEKVFKYYGGVTDLSDDQIKSLDAMWNDMKVKHDFDVMPIVDTSGSMYGLPIHVALSIGLLIAEGNKGRFKDHFITFSESPSIESIEGDNIYDKVNSMAMSDWGMNTDLKKVFSLILDTAVRNNYGFNDMPKSLLIISDMNFDMATTGRINETFYHKMERMYEEQGYDLPSIIFWYVNSDTATVDKDEEGTITVSGFSKNIFKSILKLDLEEIESYTPERAMLETINQERYNMVDGFIKRY